MKKREGYLDVLRCLAICLVLLNHCVSKYITNEAYYGSRTFLLLLGANALSNMSVPLFLMISGYLMLQSDRTRDMGGFYKKRLPRLLIPLAAWNVIYFFYLRLLRGEALTAGAFFEGLINTGNAYHLWYLYLLAGIYLLAPFLKRIADSCTDRQLWGLLGVMLLCPTLRPFLNHTFDIYIHLFDPLFNGYVGYFLLGYLLGRARPGRMAPLIGLLLAAAGIALAVTENYAASSEKGVNLVYTYGASITRYLTGAGVFLLARSCLGRESRLTRAAGRLCPLVFGIYVIHVAVLELFWEKWMIDASPVVSAAYLWIVTLILSALLAWLLGKLPGVKKLVT